MALARFMKVCLDAQEPLALGQFWAQALGQQLVPDAKGEAGLVDGEGRYILWLNQVPQPKSVKQRVHLDIYTLRLADLEALGATVVLPDGGDRHWTVMTDPEGGEFCAFIRDVLPERRLHGIVIDSHNPTKLAKWWAKVLKADVVHHDEYSTVQRVKKLPDVTLDFVPVPEKKTVPNRLHWDVKAKSLDALLDAGATLLRKQDDEIAWSVLADPEGNEFCAFPKS